MCKERTWEIERTREMDNKEGEVRIMETKKAKQRTIRMGEKEGLVTGGRESKSEGEDEGLEKEREGVVRRKERRKARKGGKHGG